jgi:prepilin-type N-terminal cleavage/methylation domain-containing protein
MKKEDLKKQHGFTMVELVIALTLLLLVALSFVPMFVYISEGSQNNRARLIALKLASSKIEEIRALPYDKIGTVGGDPAGVIPQEETKTIDNINFTIKTNIWWVDDPSDNDASGHDPLPYDYKRVKVAVESPSMFTGKVVKTAKIDTLASMEGEEEAYPGGNIRVIMQRGWQTGSEPEPVSGAKVELVTGPSAPRTQFTDELGKFLFAILDKGDYTVKANPPSGMMIKPGASEQEVEVVEKHNKIVTFEAEYPCSLKINLIDFSSGGNITSGGTLVLETPFSGNVSKDFTPDLGGILPADFLGDLWPIGAGSFGNAYGIKVFADGYLPYDLNSDEDPDQWDGKFNQPGETKSINIRLKPANASVTVVSSVNNAPIAGETVKLYKHEFINGVGTCTPIATAVTNQNGIASFYLEDNKGTPGDGSYDCYCVLVTKDGYNTFEEHGAFRVIGGQQMIDSTAIDTYEVILQPITASIRVKVTINGWPWQGRQVRVQGPDGYDEQRTTDTNGEALFTNLKPGTYTVKTFYWYWWYTQTVDIISGEYTVEFKF